MTKCTEVKRKKDTVWIILANCQGVLPIQECWVKNLVLGRAAMTESKDQIQEILQIKNSILLFSQVSKQCFLTTVETQSNLKNKGKTRKGVTFNTQMKLWQLHINYLNLIIKTYDVCIIMICILKIKYIQAQCR